MKKVILIILILFMSIRLSSFFLQETKDITEINGNDWEVMDASWKLGYLMGIHYGGLFFAGEYNTLLRTRELLIEDEITEATHDLIQKLYFWGGSFGQAIDGLDELYKDYSNKRIPIHLLAIVIYKKISGKISSEELEKELQKLRAKVSK